MDLITENQYVALAQRKESFRHQNAGSGRTTKLIKDAPIRSVLVVKSDRDAFITQDQANRLGRSDIKVFSYQDTDKMRAQRPTEIIFDHDLILTKKEWEELFYLKIISKKSDKNE